MPNSQTPAQLAKAALVRLVQARQEPTPENFARAYAEERGGAPAAVTSPVPAAAPADNGPASLDGAAWSALIGRVVRGLERGSRQWTPARKKDSVQRVLSGSRADAARLHQRLSQLMQAWETDGADVDVDVPDGEGAAVAVPTDNTPAPVALPAAVGEAPPDTRMAASLNTALRVALPADEPRARELADELALLAQRAQTEGVSAGLIADVAGTCERVQRLFAHRHHLVDELMGLCRSLTEGLAELAEDDSWAQGQSIALRARLDAGASVRAVRAAGNLLAETRLRHRELREERAEARDALKAMIRSMLGELGELSETTGRYGDSVARHAETIARADSIESLAEAVREMVGETRAIHALISGARERLASEHNRAGELESKVQALESELRRLSEEVTTDALTQVANRRGLMLDFEAERDKPLLAVGLLDIDNFKKLNDTLGHSAGDVALKALAERVKSWLRPADHLARYGGEEFVVLLPATEVAEGQQVLTRLQRRMSASLFMHEGQEVFVTFSAGVTAYRAGETIEAALERADEALYEAKRTGKNRTCMA